MQDPSEVPLGFGSTTFTHSHSGLSLASCIFQGLVVTHSLAHACLFLLLPSAAQTVGGSYCHVVRKGAGSQVWAIEVFDGHFYTCYPNSVFEDFQTAFFSSSVEF